MSKDNPISTDKCAPRRVFPQARIKARTIPGSTGLGWNLQGGY